LFCDGTCAKVNDTINIKAVVPNTRGNMVD
jgi:hypothetical protein